MRSDNILGDAESIPSKQGLEEHFEAMQLLRQKGYSWREVANFLNERGVATDHTKVYRQYKKLINKTMITIPSTEEYVAALQDIEITDKQKQMLEAHYSANRATTSYTELAHAADFDKYNSANLQYGTFAKKLGDKLNFKYAESTMRKGELFYGSVIGYMNNDSKDEFQLVMHPELMKALCKLDWF